MKLNNKGWGLPELLIGIGIIIVFLLIAVFYSLRLNRMLQGNFNNSNVKEEINEDYYILKTNDIMDAAYRYINKEDIELEYGVNTRISLSTLISKGYIGKIYDSKTNNACMGYAIASLDVSKITDIKAYIKCDNYVSKGYGN